MESAHSASAGRRFERRRLGSWGGVASLTTRRVARKSHSTSGPSGVTPGGLRSRIPRARREARATEARVCRARPGSPSVGCWNVSGELPERRSTLGPSCGTPPAEARANCVLSLIRRSASVGESRAARVEGYRQATAPMMRAAPTRFGQEWLGDVTHACAKGPAAGRSRSGDPRPRRP